ncbi:hypothetical protein EHQ94_19835 [Leptospira meyeri]|uniref:hypothetical protein n=1 Tax=Leptospira meyeri TaxID=29508 RepID=UPI0010843D1E|nr:hypothetical protein [Leptospira meyeri]TGM62924.1 hypothetical protein EHQ94_19835 [Leptospira meyeri]TGM65832.1 hypothetical protein EHQ93_08955 [Leptospira meyeri]
MKQSEINSIIESTKKDLRNNITDGFYHIQTGRAGSIYFIENNCVVSFMTEMSGSEEYDLLVSGELEYISDRFDLRNSTHEILPRKERKRIQKKLIEWLSNKKIRHDLHSDEWRPDFE